MHLASARRTWFGFTLQAILARPGNEVRLVVGVTVVRKTSQNCLAFGSVQRRK
jgi:hypothetical protein